jgi:hypothetical protein
MQTAVIIAVNYAKLPSLVFAIDPLNYFRHSPVFICDDVSGIVGGEVDFHRVPHIAPIGVMILPFGVKGHFGHKSERLHKIPKPECCLQAIFIFVPHGEVG